MKTCLKKLAVSMAIAAGSAATMPAHAVLQGLPGEAQLVPFVYANDAVDPVLNAEVNTIIRFVVPRSVGQDTMIQFTAPHVMQGGPLSTQPNGRESTNSPGLAELTPGIPRVNEIHWILLDRQSRHVWNDTFPVTPDDVQVVDVYRDVLRPLGFDSVIGYLVAVTEAAYTGVNSADFAFFADAYMTLQRENEVRNGIVTIPTLAMSDGADTAGVGPKVFNEVVSLDRVAPRVSPIASGIRTSGEQPWRVIDLTLNEQGRHNATLMVFWNDRNLGDKGEMPGYVYDTEEDFVSRNVVLPYEISTALVGYNTELPTTEDPQCGSGKVASLLCAYNASTNPFGVNNIVPLTAGWGKHEPGPAGAGFYKMFIPRPEGSSTGLSDSAMMAFSIGLYNPKKQGGPVAASAVSGNPYWDVYSDTWMPHDHGTFTGM